MAEDKLPDPRSRSQQFARSPVGNELQVLLDLPPGDRVATNKVQVSAAKGNQAGVERSLAGHDLQNGHQLEVAVT